MAAPACPLAETFRPFPPLGHGLAAGTMIWMDFETLVLAH